MGTTKRIRKLMIGLFCLVVVSGSLLLDACGTKKEEKPLTIYADTALETVLPLTGEKFNVLNGKNYKLNYVFESSEQIQKDVSSGTQCDIVITDSSSVLEELAKKGFVNKEKAQTIGGSRLAIISPYMISSLSDIFYIPEYDEEYGDYEERDGFIYIDELLTEEDWEEDWEYEELPPLLINENISKIAICTPQNMEGKKAKEQIDFYFDKRNFIENYDLLIYCENDEEVIEKVSSGTAQVGICLETSFDETMAIQPRAFITGENINYIAATVNDSIHKQDAALFMDFIQSSDAKRFFADFNFD